MRIIQGLHKGKQLHPPKDLPVRPTTDFAKEALFNILNNQVDFEELQVLDLFCGTGNISLEFASREAKQVTAVDLNTKCLRFVKETASALKLEQVFTLRADAFKFLKSATSPYDLIFADPPYDLPNIEEIYTLVTEHQLIKPGGLLIIEHGPKTKLDQQAHYAETRHYGNVHFSFFRY